LFSASIHGFILALGLILPLGVQNMFVFNQSAIQPRFSKALPAIITAALCDTLLIALAILGVSVIVLEYEWLRILLYILGIAFLGYTGMVLWRSKPAQHKQAAAQSFRPAKQVAFALSVSLLNPHAVIDTVGVVGTSSLQYTGVEKVAFAIVCIGVSWLWFLGLGIAGRTVGRLDQSGRLMPLVNRLSALIMWGTGAYLGYGLIQLLH